MIKIYFNSKIYGDRGSFKCGADGLRLTMHSSSLWQVKVKPSKKPKHIPSPVQARQGAFLLGPVQERLECENVICNFV
jgi:hypothetical protein